MRNGTLVLPILLLILIRSLSFGQIKEIVPPTPNAMKLTEFHAQKPNLYTGTASVAIPLYEINFDGWKLPLSLSYNATGIRTNEEASEVGLGWALNATGIISRTVKDSDDLLKGINSERKGYVYANPITYNFGFDWRTDPFPPDGSYYQQLVNSHPDTQPDIFNYIFFGFSGSFILPKHQTEPSDIVKVIKLTQDATLIKFDKINKTFTVTTPQGYLGEFSVKELSTSIASSTVAINRMDCCGQNQIDIDQTKNSGRYRAISTWYLARITSPRGQVINFNYDLNIDGSSPYLSQSRAFAELESIVSHETCLQTVQEHVYLKKIESEEIRIDFLMEPRQDLKLNTIYITGGYFPISDALKRFTGLTIHSLDPASTLNKTITFRQSYFNIQYQNNYQETEDEVRWMRSRLDRVIIDDQEYRFYYEKGDKGLPDKLTTGIDHFGFYNGQDNTVQVLPPQPVSGSFLGFTDNFADSTPLEIYKQRFERRVQFGNGKAGLLVKLKFPSRGYTVFEYEPHTYLPDQTGKFNEQLDSYENTAGGARIKSIKEYDYNDVLVLSKTYKYFNDATAQSASQSPPTGLLMTPLYNRYGKLLHDTSPNHTATGINFLHRTHSSIPGNNSAEGKVIGYSKVHEIVNKIGTNENYKNTYYFENRKNVISTWNAVATGDPNINGQTMQIRKYDSQGKIVQQTQNPKQYYEHLIGSTLAIAYEFDPTNTTYLDYLVRYSLPWTFHTPYRTIIDTSETPSGIVEATDSTITGKTIQTQTDLTYSTTGPTPTYLLKSQQMTNSNNDIVKTEYKRPLDYTTPSTHLTYMISKNMVDAVIEEMTSRNVITIAAMGNYYERESPTGTRVNLRATYSYNKLLGNFTTSTNGLTFASPYEKKTEITYDLATGKVKEYIGADGISNSFIWGYNNKLPVVHGVGLTQEQLLTAYNTAVGSQDYETTIRTQASASGGQVTTYVHNPQVGITQATNPAQLKKTFQYDVFARLNKVLDETDKTLEQYQYHLKELPITRNLALSSNSLDFGTFYDCSLPPPKILILTNDGEDDLKITGWNVPNNFKSPWPGSGEVPSGTSVYIPISFTGVPGNYNTSIIFTSDRTDGPSTVTVPLSANYMSSGGDKTIQLSNPNPLIFTNVHEQKIVMISNVGNACFMITGVTVSDTQNWSANVPDSTILMPGQSTPMSIFMTGQNISNGITPAADITVISSKNLGNNVMHVSFPTRLISVSPSNLPFTPFNGPSTTENVTVNNTQGNSTLTINSVSSTNDMFTVSPKSFSIPAGSSQQVTVTFTPTAFNFSQQTSTITFNSDKTNGNNSLTVNGQRTSIRTISLSPNPFAFDGLTFSPQNVTITNNGNDYIYITAVTNNNTPHWDASISNLPVTLTPNQTTSIAIVKKVATPSSALITVQSNNNGNEVLQLSAVTRIMDLSSTNIIFPYFTSTSSTQPVTVSNTGNSTLSINGATSSNPKFTVSPSSFNIAAGSNQVVTITYNSTDYSFQTSNIAFIGNPTAGITTLSASAQQTSPYTMVIGISPGSISLPAFTSPSVSANVIISNTGNSPLTISSVSSTNSMFTASPTSFTVPAGGQQTVAVTLTPTGYNFGIQTTTLTFNGNQTSGINSLSVTGNRTRIKTIQLSTNSLVFNSIGPQYVTVSNIGNDLLNINGVSIPSTPNWSASITPTVLSPSQNTTLTIVKTNGTSETLNISVQSDKLDGNETVQVSYNQPPTQIISLSGVTFPSFTGTSVSQNLTVSNTGNSMLSVTGISSSNAKFTMSPTVFTVPAGGNQVVTISYTPTDFTSQSTTVTVSSNASSGTSTLNTSAQRTQLYQMSVSPGSVVVKPWAQTQTVYIYNTGNVNVTISTVGNSNTSKFTRTLWQAGGYASATLPYTIAPGSRMEIKVTSADGSYSSASGTLTILNSQGTNYIVNMSLATF